ncbi:hypothetical protein IEN85_03655 [Pelagicoccus sp. NFK12]|uniref:Uncharacterized protein n=1 Tax=Pelagicoccus enzymogenes TaxID=2773457 RepID=A0A927IGE1_9BACT|nr:hypothetical protein [Pelagicoccus enzymogenes]MBD5778573.1 hypothetical protein [Pelagicoccus enzymogenes]
MPTLSRCLTSAILVSAAYLQAETPPDLSTDFEEWQLAEKGIIESMPDDYQLVGRLTPRDATQISSSLLGIGGETMDRDFTRFEAWSPYLEPLGAKRIRLQSGWAKTETQKGKYDFAWLDRIVNGCLAAGVQPWLSLSYGNPIYEGAGGTGLGGGLPHSAEALQAWENYVRASIQHFGDRVETYEIWNEADLKHNQSQAGAYPRLYERTARIIREEQPDATILALALAYVHARPDSGLVDFVETLAAHDTLHLVDGITVHGYPANPDHGFERHAEVQAYLSQHLPHAVIWQGETGAPSERAPKFALKNLDWTELSQAKWDLRRALAHWSREIPFSLFSISEMNYDQQHFDILNTKGKLKIRPNDLSIERPKISYFSYRNACSLFADQRVPQKRDTAIANHSSLYSFKIHDRANGKQGFVFWDAASQPGDRFEAQRTDIVATDLSLQNPVLLDLLSGLVWSLPEATLAQFGPSLSLYDMPVWDSPRVIADAQLFDWTPLNQP